MFNFQEEAQSLFPFSQEIRRDFHQHPELGFQEFRTAARVAAELGALGLEVCTGIAKTGVAAVVEGGRPGPVTMLRVDMDALPIQEQNDVEYTSCNPGVMHACGHDAHTAIGLTVAKMLVKHQANLCGKVKLIFQPAEEAQGGASQMIADGILHEPEVDYVLGVHVWNEKPLGWCAATNGPVMAGADFFKVEIEGKGGHGAVPHYSIDPVIATAHLITALNTIVSRNISPLEAGVLSVTKVLAGDAYNVIPQKAEIGGTIRSFSSQVRETILQRLVEICEGTAKAFQVQIRPDLTGLALPVVNDPQVSQWVRNAIESQFPEMETSADYRTMGSEDMAFYLKEKPGCFLLIGSADLDSGKNFPHHHPRFDIDERVMPQAAAILTAALFEMGDKG